jgi:hypothetical protein
LVENICASDYAAMGSPSPPTKLGRAGATTGNFCCVNPPLEGPRGFEPFHLCQASGLAGGRWLDVFMDFKSQQSAHAEKQFCVVGCLYLARTTILANVAGFGSKVVPLRQL